MGFFGFFVLAQAEASMGGLSGVPGTHAVRHETTYGAGWRLAQLPDTLDVTTSQLAGLLASATGRPALAIQIHDSDVGTGEAVIPNGGGASFFLNEVLAIEMFGDYGFTPREDNAEAVPALALWARQAGLTTNPDALAAAMAGSPGPFGEGVHDLVLALGIPAA
jgi:hypothetical protein